jgi:GNAT superfamily N-acetyltransferase
MRIEYRDTQDVDVPQLASLFRSVGWTARAEQPERLAQLLRGSMFVVSAWAEEGARLVGFAAAISNGAWHAYVTSVAVHPDHQRSGIGKEVVRRLMADRDGIQFVLHADPPVHPFYAKLGYVTAPEMLKRPRSF